MIKLHNNFFKRTKIMALLFFLFPFPVLSIQTSCFIETGKYFNIDPVLLRAIAEVESNFNPAAIGRNSDSKGNLQSQDYGLMQINQSHVPNLINQGIISSEKDLITDPCLNIKIGTWILYKHFSRCGVNWSCLGTYNAGFSVHNSKKRKEYSLKVHKAYIRNRQLMLNREKKGQQ